MKKILTFLMIVMALFAFISCDNGNGGNPGTDNTDPDKVAATFSDCTTVVNSTEGITLSDGNWTVTAFEPEDEGWSSSMIIKATVKDGVKTFTSGTETIKMDCAIKFKDNPEVLEALEGLSDDEKTKMMEEMQGEKPEGAKVEWDGLKIIMTMSIEKEDLDDMAEELDFSKLPSDAVVKSNADNTKYVIIIEYEDDKEEIYISKD